MIKTIKKIDLQGKETWQEVVICNRCKKTLEPTDYVYETKWTAWYPVKMESVHAYGFVAGSNPVKHICKCCTKEVEDFINGKDAAKEIYRLAVMYYDGNSIDSMFFDELKERFGLGVDE